jgi:DHA1 family bicyclomycin/chloramphenicol resistance-like MFS transporter
VLKPGSAGLTLLLGALIAFAPLAMDIYLASMPSMTRALDATPEQVNLTLSLYMYAWGASQLVAGPLADRSGRRPALLGGLVAFVLASIGCALASSVQALIGARIAQALHGQVRVGGLSVPLRASIGVAWSDDPAVSADELLARADAAMYVSKRNDQCEPVLSQD